MTAGLPKIVTPSPVVFVNLLNGLLFILRRQVMDSFMPLRKNTIALLLAVLLVAACGGRPDPKSVRFYLENDLVREDMIAGCNADGGRLRGSPDCRNASVASTRIEGKKDREKKASREATSKRKLDSIRARQAQLSLEQKRLAREVAELEPSNAPIEQALSSEPAQQTRSFGAPTSAPMVDVAPQPTLPPVITTPVEALTVQDQQTNERVMPSVAESLPLGVPAPTPANDDWAGTPSQVQISPMVDAPAEVPEEVAEEVPAYNPFPEAPVRDPSTISLDDLPGSDKISSAAVPLQRVTDTIQEALSDEDAEEDSGE